MKEMVRRAEQKDIPALMGLLTQVAKVHSDGRPDLFRPGATKYTEEQLKDVLREEDTPVFVLERDGRVVGHAFCVFQKVPEENHALMPVKTLYIDDICVDAVERGAGAGKALYEAVVAFARESGCYNVTLNVWELNQGALEFYKKMGLSTQKTGMEYIL